MSAAHFASVLLFARQCCLDCQSKRHKHATPSQVRRAALLAHSELDESDDDGSAAAAGASRRPSRRAAAEAMQKLHAQAAMGKRRHGHSHIEERKEASANPNASKTEDSGKRRGASAAASTASSSSDNEASDAEPRSDGDDAAEASDSSGSSALSELSAAESNDELELFIDDPDVLEFDDDEAEEWQPPSAAAAAARRLRAPVRAPRWLLKIPPLRAVQRFIVDQLDAEELCGSARAIVKHVLEILDARKSV